MTFDNVLYAYLMSGLKKYAYFFSFTVAFFKVTLSVLRCTWTGQINLKIFLGMKNVVKCYKDFFGYFNALKTHGDEGQELQKK